MTNPIEGKYYDWPVGYRVGLNLRDFWQPEDHALGETTFTHFPDGTAKSFSASPACVEPVRV